MDKWYESEESGLNKSLAIFALSVDCRIFVLLPSQSPKEGLAWFDIQDGMYRTAKRYQTVDEAIKALPRSINRICNGRLSAKLAYNYIDRED